MADLIDRQELRRAMYHEAMEKDSDEQKWDSGCWIRYRMFERVLKQLPSAQPEIVRCRECKHWDYDFLIDEGWCNGLHREPDDFCSRAQRRKESEG